MQRADYVKSYFLRFLWVSLACAAFTLWCCYDAFVTYPKKGKVSAAFEAVEAKMKEEEMEMIRLPEQWEKVATKNGWSATMPSKTSEDIRADIGKQYFMMVLCGLVGIPAFIKWCSAHGTWVEGDAELIRNSAGQELKISEITKIDKRKWEEKGIAYIHYLKDGKRKKKFLMDDFKFEPETMGQLMQFAEAGLKPDQITGGLTQKEIAAKKEQEAAAKKQRAESEAAQEEPAQENA